MSDDKHWVDKEHFVKVSDDGKTSYKYQTDGWTETCVEITKHHGDGTSDAYEVGGVMDSLFGDGTGKHKQTLDLKIEYVV